MSPSLPREAEDLCAAVAQPLHGQHVVGPPSRVSPRVPAKSSERDTSQATTGRWRRGKCSPDDLMNHIVGSCLLGSYFESLSMSYCVGRVGLEPTTGGS